MRPAQSMYATREDWQSDIVKWLESDPSVDNCKEFMLFKGKIGQHTLQVWTDFKTYLEEDFLGVETWQDLVEAAKQDGYVILLEDTAEYDTAASMLEFAEVDDLPEEYYDSNGNVSPGGIYDAGGHLNAERMADHADYIRDQLKYRK